MSDLGNRGNWWKEVRSGWDRFWFVPSQPHTLALIRILAGAMLLYTHAVWTLRLTHFLGPDAWIPADLSQDMHAHRGDYVWTFWWYVKSPALMWTIHSAALVVFTLFTLGLWTRVVSVLAWFLTLNYCHRLTGALFGLDQVNTMLATYLMFAPCGAVYSIDRWLAKRKGRAGEVVPSVGTTVATRLIQLHLCVIYLFGGIGKLRGGAWWDGGAVWMSIANYEYQSLDMTWLGRYKPLVALMTHITVLWETFYCFLVWNRLTRPVAIWLAVIVHGGIAMALGMITFGTIMIVANMAFLAPATVEAWLRPLYSRREERRVATA